MDASHFGRLYYFDHLIIIAYILLLSIEIALFSLLNNPLSELFLSSLSLNSLIYRVVFFLSIVILYFFVVIL